MATGRATAKSTPGKAVPPPVRRALTGIGEHLGTWRRLRGLTVIEVAERADVARSTVLRLETGHGASLEALLRVARALGVLDDIVGSLDPYRSDVGRLRAEEQLPQRVRRRSDYPEQS
ncbi:helix-turn-helix domain-containing protein [uncultured Jatrophihabitans sp.]|uniref:helix-turn-helix domain-containing protein n=1 Tax=uncultured Jatrophihabitans sp. TaxID=1610747 RepID=UPI0035C9C2EA